MVRCFSWALAAEQGTESAQSCKSLVEGAMSTALCHPEERPASLLSREPMRVVLDASVVVSALVFGGGAPAVLRHAWQRRRFVPLLSGPTLQDLEVQLATPRLGLSVSERWGLLGEYLPYVQRVDLSGRERAASVDAASTAVSYGRLATVGRARAWVTADLELLGLQSEALCPRYSIDAFVRLMLSQRRRRVRHGEAMGVL